MLSLKSSCFDLTYHDSGGLDNGLQKFDVWCILTWILTKDNTEFQTKHTTTEYPLIQRQYKSKKYGEENEEFPVFFFYHEHISEYELSKDEHAKIHYFIQLQDIRDIENIDDDDIYCCECELSLGGSVILNDTKTCALCKNCMESYIQWYLEHRLYRSRKIQHFEGDIISLQDSFMQKLNKSFIIS